VFLGRTASEGIMKDAVAELRALSSDELLRFLTAQRWFGAKGASPTNARVIDAVIAPWGDGNYAFARIGVDVNGAEQVYQLPVILSDLPVILSEAKDLGPASYQPQWPRSFAALRMTIASKAPDIDTAYSQAASASATGSPVHRAADSRRRSPRTARARSRR